MIASAWMIAVSAGVVWPELRGGRTTVTAPKRVAAQVSRQSIERKASETVRRREFWQSDGGDLAILPRVRSCQVTNLFPI